MNQSKCWHDDETGVVYINCPGCGHPHSLDTVARNECGAMWTWNKDTVHPTFSPSLNVSWYYNKSDGTRIDGQCHSFINNGMIQFLDDCTHELKGQTVSLPDWDSNEPK